MPFNRTRRPSCNRRALCRAAVLGEASSSATIVVDVIRTSSLLTYILPMSLAFWIAYEGTDRNDPKPAMWSGTCEKQEEHFWSMYFTTLYASILYFATLYASKTGLDTPSSLLRKWLKFGGPTTRYASTRRQVMGIVTHMQIPKLFCRGGKTFRNFVLGNVFSELVGEPRVGFIPVLSSQDRSQGNSALAVHCMTKQAIVTSADVNGN
jgi:hypothetical protein